MRFIQHAVDIKTLGSVQKFLGCLREMCMSFLLSKVVVCTVKDPCLLPERLVVFGPDMLCNSALETRLNELKAAIRSVDREVSSWTACLIQSYQHLWEEMRILDYANHIITLLIKEAMHSSFSDQEKLLNRVQGIDNDCCWKNLFRKNHQEVHNRV